MEIYEPREDSYLLAKEARKYTHGNVLDMGTGTGLLAIAAAHIADRVIGADINKKAVKYAEKIADEKGIENIEFVHSDLFSYFRKHPALFDLIIFNPPYLPEDKAEPKGSRPATTGGKKGHELLERFFSEAGEYLKPDGKVLFLFSTLTGKEKVHSIMENYCYNYQKLAEESFFMETIFVYLAEKSEFLKEIESEGIKSIKKLAKGHRGVVFTGELNKKKIAVKKQREDVPVAERIKNEARWLNLLNRKGIGPKLIFEKDDYFAYEFVEGKFFPQWLEKADKKGIAPVIKDILRQCYIVDSMSANKEEMHHPLKHIIIKNRKPVLIDFERMHYSEKPKNATQFCQYISGTAVLNLLRKKGFKFNKTQITSAASRYKKEMNEENFEKIIELVK